MRAKRTIAYVVLTAMAVFAVAAIVLFIIGSELAWMALAAYVAVALLPLNREHPR